MKVFVYFNLHRKCWSIRAMDGPNRGRVVHHAKEFYVSGATFNVGEGGRQRVLRERRKNVHAGIVGTLDWFVDLQNVPHGELSRTSNNGAKISYNPYYSDHFYMVDEWRTPVYNADAVFAAGTIVLAFNAR